MRNEYGLPQILGEILIALRKSGPKAGGSFPQGFGIELSQVRPHLECFIDLKRLQFPDRNPPNQLPEPVFAELQVDFRKLHRKSAYHRRDSTPADLGRTDPRLNYIVEIGRAHV